MINMDETKLKVSITNFFAFLSITAAIGIAMGVALSGKTEWGWLAAVFAINSLAQVMRVGFAAIITANLRVIEALKDVEQ